MIQLKKKDNTSECVQIKENSFAKYFRKEFCKFRTKTMLTSNELNIDHSKVKHQISQCQGTKNQLDRFVFDCKIKFQWNLFSNYCPHNIPWSKNISHENQPQPRVGINAHAERTKHIFRMHLSLAGLQFFIFMFGTATSTAGTIRSAVNKAIFRQEHPKHWHPLNW